MLTVYTIKLRRSHDFIYRINAETSEKAVAWAKGIAGHDHGTQHNPNVELVSVIEDPDQDTPGGYTVTE